MDRRRLLAGLGGFGAFVAARQAFGAIERVSNSGAPRLEPPARDHILVAFAISPGFNVIDHCGPWEVFQDVHVPERGGDMEQMMAFRLFTVSESKQPIRGTGGLTIVPEHTFADAPPARVVVVGAQRGSPALHEWLRKSAKTADLVMSVCTGAFQLARAGLLSGLSATTHHDSIDRFAQEFPDVRVQKGQRFVDNGRIATAGGLTSGVDLALHVVSRYYGTAAAERTAQYLEYRSSGWTA
jgi:transcriptional regulator GlxA family with amidase domain